MMSGAPQPRLRPWLAVGAVALAATLLYALPIMVGRASTPEGWRFTWNYNASPDVMQYRVWQHEARKTGPLISNTLTSEPNPPHLLVLTYYLIGRIASAGGWSPDAVSVGVGALSAFALTVLLFVCIRTFTASSRQTWWVFFVVLLGGGLGGHIKLVSSAASAAGLPWIQGVINAALQHWLLWEEYRGHYVFNTLFDTHFLVVWLFTTGSVLALYHSIRSFSIPRLALASALCGLTTLVHVYEGVTLVAIATAIGIVCWHKQIAVRSAILSAAACTFAVVVAMIVLSLLYRQSGLPVPSWRALNILASIVLIAYPVAWLIIVPGLRAYWISAGLNEVFLIGWAAGCLFVLFSGPFYAYPDRGAITLQIPLYVTAGAIYFQRHARPRWQHIVVLVLLLGATPLWILKHRLEMARTIENAPYAFLTPDHQAILAVLNDRARAGDVMLERERDVLWLAPGYTGSTYCGHFFLTVDFERKRAETERFFAESDRAWQSQFLREHVIRFVFVPADRRPGRFVSVEGLRQIISNRVGDLFEVDRR
jgi:hypothetical protein